MARALEKKRHWLDELDLEDEDTPEPVHRVHPVRIARSSKPFPAPPAPAPAPAPPSPAVAAPPPTPAPTLVDRLKKGTEAVGAVTAAVEKAANFYNKVLKPAGQGVISAAKFARMLAGLASGKPVSVSDLASVAPKRKLKGDGFFGDKPPLSELHAMDGEGFKPKNELLHSITKAAYEPNPPETIGDLRLVHSTPTLKFYEGPDKTIVVGVRGTQDFRDVRADALISVGALEKSMRFRADLKELKKFQQTHPPDQYDYYACGHSLGGAVLDGFLKKGLVKMGRSYNPAVQLSNLGKNADNNHERVYSHDDPLGRIFRPFLPSQGNGAPEVRAPADPNAKRSILDAHGLSTNFDGGGFLDGVAAMIPGYRSPMDAVKQAEGQKLYGSKFQAGVAIANPFLKTFGGVSNPVAATALAASKALEAASDYDKLKRGQATGGSMDDDLANLNLVLAELIGTHATDAAASVANYLVHHPVSFSYLHAFARTLGAAKQELLRRAMQLAGGSLDGTDDSLVLHATPAEKEAEQEDEVEQETGGELSSPPPVGPDKAAYKHAKLYIIRSPNTPKVYIGSTYASRIERRLQSHVNKYKRHKQGKAQHYITVFDVIKHGSPTISLLGEKAVKSRAELEAWEAAAIARYKQKSGRVANKNTPGVKRNAGGALLTGGGKTPAWRLHHQRQTGAVPPAAVATPGLQTRLTRVEADRLDREVEPLVDKFTNSLIDEWSARHGGARYGVDFYQFMLRKHEGPRAGEDPATFAAKVADVDRVFEQANAYRRTLERNVRRAGGEHLDAAMRERAHARLAQDYRAPLQAQRNYIEEALTRIGHNPDRTADIRDLQHRLEQVNIRIRERGHRQMQLDTLPRVREDLLRQLNADTPITAANATYLHERLQQVEADIREAERYLALPMEPANEVLFNRAHEDPRARHSTFSLDSPPAPGSAEAALRDLEADARLARFSDGGRRLNAEEHAARVAEMTARAKAEMDERTRVMQATRHRRGVWRNMGAVLLPGVEEAREGDLDEDDDDEEDDAPAPAAAAAAAPAPQFQEPDMFTDEEGEAAAAAAAAAAAPRQLKPRANHDSLVVRRDPSAGDKRPRGSGLSGSGKMIKHLFQRQIGNASERDVAQRGREFLRREPPVNLERLEGLDAQLEPLRQAHDADYVERHGMLPERFENPHDSDSSFDGDNAEHMARADTYAEQQLQIHQASRATRDKNQEEDEVWRRLRRWHYERHKRRMLAPLEGTVVKLHQGEELSERPERPSVYEAYHSGYDADDEDL